MFTQVELVTADGETSVYWLDHNAEEQLPVKVGRGVRLAEANNFWKVNRVFTSLKNIEDLPVKSRLGTLIEIN